MNGDDRVVCVVLSRQKRVDMQFFGLIGKIVDLVDQLLTHFVIFLGHEHIHQVERVVAALAKRLIAMQRHFQMFGAAIHLLRLIHVRPEFGVFLFFLQFTQLGLHLIRVKVTHLPL